MKIKVPIFVSSRPDHTIYIRIEVLNDPSLISFSKMAADQIDRNVAISSVSLFDILMKLPTNSLL